MIFINFYDFYHFPHSIQNFKTYFKDTLGGFKCNCPAGFRGDHCEIDINECEIDPCKNGGECVDQTNDYKCLCPAGFSGKNCQVIP